MGDHRVGRGHAGVSGEGSDYAAQVARLAHPASLVVVRLTRPGFVDTCARCNWEGAVFNRDVLHFLDWTNPLQPDPPYRVPGPPPAGRTLAALRQQRDAGSGAREGAGAGLQPAVTGRLLVSVVHRFSSDFGHFFAQTLPLLLAVLESGLLEPAGGTVKGGGKGESQRQAPPLLLVDDSAPFVRRFLEHLGIGSSDIDNAGMGLSSLPSPSSPAHRRYHYHMARYVANAVYPVEQLAFATFHPRLVSGWNLGGAWSRRAMGRWGGSSGGGTGPLPPVLSLTAAARTEGHVLYLDREGARGGAREVRNKDEVLRVLVEVFGADRVIIFRAHEHSVRNTAALFSRAALLLGPHGAAFQNMLWCRPGAALVELYPRGMLPLAYQYHWALAQDLSLAYWVVLAEGGWDTPMQVGQEALASLAHGLRKTGAL